jgi:hypothetical protein
MSTAHGMHGGEKANSVLLESSPLRPPGEAAHRNWRGSEFVS